MAHLLGADRITTTAGLRTLLDGVSLGLDDGARVGVVGPNGAGKSTLLRLLARRQEPDDGRVTHAGGLRVGLLDQRDEPAPGTSVRELVHGPVADHTWARDARVRDVHDGLLADVDLDADVGTLSGGQRRRAALAALLVADHDVLLLDEPTNHLDVEGVAWLAEHLVARFGRAGGTGALVVVTHDRWFLDAVCTRVWEVTGAREAVPGTVQQYEGGYAAYVLARAERAEAERVAAAKRDNLLRKELAWLRRGAPARTSKPRFRLDAAAALIADEPPPRDPLELTRLATARLGKDVVDLEDVSLAFDSPTGPRTVLDGVTWRLGPGERYGVVGVNGAGKTTVLRLIAGELAPDSGRVRRGRTVVAATLSQDVGELDDVADLRVLEAVERERRSVVVGGRELTAGQLVERLGFTRERAQTRVRDLSGGERRRLQLLRLLVGEPNLLLLDEPTNDLDTDTLAALEDLLDGWPGTLVVVSHDRYLLERVCDRQVALLGDGSLAELPGGVEQYLALRRESRTSSGPTPPAPTPASPTATPRTTSAEMSLSVASGSAEATESDISARAGSGAGAAAGAGSGAGAGAPSAGEVRAARKEVARIERRLARIAEAEARLHEELAAAATDHEKVLELDTRLRALTAERDELETAWLAAAEIAG